MIYNRSRYPRIAAVFRSMKKQQHPLSGKPGPPNKRWCGMFCYPAVLVFVPGAYRRRAVPGRLRASGPQGCNSFPCGRLRPLRAPCATYSGSFFCCRPPWGIAVSFHRGVNRLFCSVPDKRGLLCPPDAAPVLSRPVRHSAALTGQQYVSGFILPLSGTTVSPGSGFLRKVFVNLLHNCIFCVYCNVYFK